MFDKLYEALNSASKNVEGEGFGLKEGIKENSIVKVLNKDGSLFGKVKAYKVSAKNNIRNESVLAIDISGKGKWITSDDYMFEGIAPDGTDDEAETIKKLMEEKDEEADGEADAEVEEPDEEMDESPADDMVEDAPIEDEIPAEELEEAPMDESPAEELEEAPIEPTEEVIEAPKDAEFKSDEELGNNLVQVLQLNPNKMGRYNTSWGDRTAVGLARTIRRVLDGESPEA